MPPDVMQSRDISRLLQAIAITVALVIQISAPLGFVTLRSLEMREALEFKARLSAGRISKYIFANAQLWEFQGTRLSEVIEFPGVDHSTFRQAIVTSAGRTIYKDSSPLSLPVISHREPLTVGGTEVGSLVIETSAYILLVQTLSVAIAAFLIAALSFMTIRHWPLRLVDRTLKDLEAQQRKTRRALVQLEQADLQLRERTHQLVQAQELGRIGDWSLKIGTNAPFLSPVAMAIMRFDATSAPNTLHALSACIVDDGGKERIQAMICDVMQKGVLSSADIRARCGDGTIADLAVSCQVAERFDDRVLRISGTIQDITHRKQAERQLERLAYFDPLTGLANRSMFQQQLEQAVAGAQQNGQPSALMLIDLDRFKEVNDSLGHASGDNLLVTVSRLISHLMPEGQFIARLGGDEIGIILTSACDRRSIEDLSALLVEVISRPLVLGGAEVVIGASIGVAILPGDGATAEEVNKHADLALYRAKDLGRGRCVFFEQEMNELIQQRMMLARDLRVAASQEGGLEVWLQPQIDLARNRVLGFEALMRWNHPTRGFIPPSQFIPIAESSSLICEIGLWILRQSARMAKDWVDAGGQPYEVAVNLSAAQIWQTSIEEDLAQILRETGLPPHLLCLELTESLLADHTEGRVRAALTRLKALGITLALDDFGTGYSSLGYLIQLPFDKLKIDRVFITEAPRSAKARQVLQGIVALGHGLGMMVVAEGVERPEELALLQEFGCDQVQGYIFAEPAPASAAFAYAVRSMVQPPLPDASVQVAQMPAA